MDVDAVVITHTHLDHWDDVARQQLPKSMPIFVQDEHDAATVRKDGFTDVRVLGSATLFNGTRLVRIGGQHGTDVHMAKLGSLLGTVSGVVFERPGHETVYIAGDTTWRPEVEAAIQQHRPDVIVLNTGYARILGFDGSIIMGKEDLARARKAAPDAVLIGVHMEAVNHAGQTRQELNEFIAEQNLDATRTLVPMDGESYHF
jgi:L-ascorbate metabolism protein UlaG (beta-lactamase superfamily)